MSSLPTRRLVLLFVLAACLLLPGEADAKKKKKRRYWYRYTVQFTCGSNASDLDRVVPGDYVTCKACPG